MGLIPNVNTITVLDYCMNQVRVYRNVHTDDPEKWLKINDPNWDDDQCYYMFGENTEVLDEERN